MRTVVYRRGCVRGVDADRCCVVVRGCVEADREFWFCAGRRAVPFCGCVLRACWRLRLTYRFEAVCPFGGITNTLGSSMTHCVLHVWPVSQLATLKKKLFICRQFMPYGQLDMM